jgi:RNA polymerase sigma-70 factor (sigma-E family)
MDASGEDFTAYAESRAPALRRTAYLLCGNWHTAEDLAQAALTKVYLAWPKLVRRGELDGYARQVLLRTYLDSRRRLSWFEVPVHRFADTPEPAGHADDRMVVLAALAELAPRQRAVLVLRYWEDLDVGTVARLLECSPGTVKSQTSKGLDALRRVLAASGMTLPEGVTA